MTERPIEIDWRIPPTKPGPAGALARFLGPGKTRGEVIVELGGGALCAALLVVLIGRAGGSYDWSFWRTVVAAVMVFDLVGGVLTNSTNSGKRWYHRAEPGMRRYRLLFAASHVFYLAAVAYILLPGDWRWLLVNCALLIGPVAVIESAPVDLKRPIAAALYLSAVLIDMTWLRLPAALAWFPVVFFLKMLVCFMVPEAPIARRAGGTAAGRG